MHPSNGRVIMSQTMAVKSDTFGLMKIGEVAERLNTTTRTLRFYEEECLIIPRRSNKGTRLYSQNDMQRFEAIMLLTNLGVHIHEIKNLASIRADSKTGNQSSHKVSDILEGLREQTLDRINEYKVLLKEIDRANSLVQKCFGCRKKPNRNSCDECPVGSDLGQPGLLSLIWDQQ